MAQPQRLVLVDESYIYHVADGQHSLQERRVATVFQRLFQSRDTLEVFAGGLLAPGDDKHDVFNAGLGRLLHRVVDGRQIDDGQHHLRYGARHRQKPCAETGGGYDGLAYSHSRSCQNRRQSKPFRSIWRDYINQPLPAKATGPCLSPVCPPGFISDTMCQPTYAQITLEAP